MAQTKVEALINYLLTTFPTDTVIGGHRIQVIDGPGALDIRNNVLYIGHSLFTPTYSASGVQEWGAVGRPAPIRRETLEVNCSLRVGQGNKDMAGCRARAVAIFDAIASTLRSTMDGFTAGGEFQNIQLSRYVLYQEFATDGASVALEFTITGIARV